MKSKSTVVMPGTEKILAQMGEQIKLARLRRKLPAELVAERAGISRSTLWNIERGLPSVAIGSYAAALHAIGGMDKDLLLIAGNDELGRKLQDIELLAKQNRMKGDE
jgi:transcriptional regulator with XRE-family HTH domain